MLQLNGQINISELVDAEAERQGKDLYALSDTLKQHITDPMLFLELEQAFSRSLSEAINISFALGWQCSKQPEQLIFCQDREGEQLGQA
jgi:hypothetical protein